MIKESSSLETNCIIKYVKVIKVFDIEHFSKNFYKRRILVETDLYKKRIAKAYLSCLLDYSYLLDEVKAGDYLRVILRPMWTNWNNDRGNMMIKDEMVLFRAEITSKEAVYNGLHKSKGASGSIYFAETPFNSICMRVVSIGNVETMFNKLQKQYLTGTVGLFDNKQVLAKFHAFDKDIGIFDNLKPNDLVQLIYNICFINWVDKKTKQDMVRQEYHVFAVNHITEEQLQQSCNVLDLSEHPNPLEHPEFKKRLQNNL